MTDTDNSTSESTDADAQRADCAQGKTRRIETVAELFYEKFADGERTFIDPKGETGGQS